MARQGGRQRQRARRIFTRCIIIVSTYLCPNCDRPFPTGMTLFCLPASLPRHSFSDAGSPERKKQTILCAFCSSALLRVVSLSNDGSAVRLMRNRVCEYLYEVCYTASSQGPNCGFSVGNGLTKSMIENSIIVHGEDQHIENTTLCMQHLFSGCLKMHTAGV